MKVGVIGLGAIAQKAYLPLLAAKGDLDIVLATRNSQTLDRISRQYRIPQKVGSVDELIHTGIQAAFVHTATEAHFLIVQRLLDSGIHVYVDKPLAYSLKEARDLVELAARRQRLLMVGFNPVSYTHLRAHETRHDLVCRLLLEKKKKKNKQI